MTIVEFGNLFSRVEVDLKELFSKSPSILLPSQTSAKAVENRFKIFVTLYRMKVGCSFHSMESIFGMVNAGMVHIYRRNISS